MLYIQDAPQKSSQEEVVYLKYKQSSAINRLYANLSKTCPGLLENYIFYKETLLKKSKHNINVDHFCIVTFFLI